MNTFFPPVSPFPPHWLIFSSFSSPLQKFSSLFIAEIPLAILFIGLFISCLLLLAVASRWSNYYRILCPTAAQPLHTVQRTCEFLDLQASLSSVSYQRPRPQTGEQSKQDGFGLHLFHTCHWELRKYTKGLDWSVFKFDNYLSTGLFWPSGIKALWEVPDSHVAHEQ